MYVCVCIYTCIYVYIYAHVYACLYTYMNLPAPMNHVNVFKGWPLRDAPSKLLQLWYKTFPPDHGGQVKMKDPTRLSNKTSTA